MPSLTFGERSIELFREKGTVFITTLAVIEFTARRRLANQDFLNEPLIVDTTPPFFLEAVRAEATRTLSADEQATMPRRQARLPAVLRNTKLLHDQGLLIVAGTDAPYPGVFQGESLHRELELLVEAGLTPVQAIAVATGNAAKLVGSDSWGVIAPGRRADLVIVDGRPDRNIADSRRIVAVLQAGRSIVRARLKYDPKTDPGYRASAPAN
jgi:imidazolonepropionase-like amidohydrolase